MDPVISNKAVKEPKFSRAAAERANDLNETVEGHPASILDECAAGIRVRVVRGRDLFISAVSMSVCSESRRKRDQDGRGSIQTGPRQVNAMNGAVGGRSNNRDQTIRSSVK